MVVSPQNNFAEILQERLASRARRHASSCPSIGWWFTDWARPHPVHCTQHSTGRPSYPQASRKTSSCKYVEDHEVRVRCRPVGVRIRGTLPRWACGQCAASAAHAVPTVAAVTRLCRPHLTSCLAVPPLSYAILQANVSATYVQVCATALAACPAVFGAPQSVVLLAACVPTWKLCLTKRVLLVVLVCVCVYAQ